MSTHNSTEVPPILFDGYTVFKALSLHAQSRTSAENVSDVLDALVYLWRLPEPEHQNDVQAAFGGLVQTPQE